MNIQRIAFSDNSNELIMAYIYILLFYLIIESLNKSKSINESEISLGNFNDNSFYSQFESPLIYD